jgi:hypothetical protein
MLYPRFRTRRVRGSGATRDPARLLLRHGCLCEAASGWRTGGGAIAGDLCVLMYVDHHNDAYHWAEGRRVAVNPTTGALQLFAVEPVIEPAIKQVRQENAAQEAAPARPLFANLSDGELMSLGVPQELLNVVRSICSENELDATQRHLPVEAYEGLFLVMAGDTVSQVLASRDTRIDKPIDTTNFLAAIETPEAQSRFVVVADEETMAAMLNSPLSQWRVFLHPTQRKLAQGDRSGPTRVLGGAGTGKTVLAMHRAKWLAEQRSAADKKVLFTTFTRNLAADIEENLKTLCSPSVMQKIEVRNLDAGFTASCDATNTNTRSSTTGKRAKRPPPGAKR